MLYSGNVNTKIQVRSWVILLNSWADGLRIESY